MSGDVQPRKRKDKRRKKDPQQEYVSTKMKTPRDEVIIPSEEIPTNFSLEETFHIHKDSATGGNICTKVVFFCLLSALAVMVGLLLTEYHGSTDVDTPISESRWAAIFDGWIDEFSNKNDNHAEHIERHEDEDENEKDVEDHDNNNDIANHDEEENNSNHDEEDDNNHDEEEDDSNHDEEEDDSNQVEEEDDSNQVEEEDDSNQVEEEDDSNYNEDDDIEPIEENTSEEPLDENELFVSEEVDTEEDNEKDIEGDEDENEDEELDTDLEDNETEEMDEGEINKEDDNDDDDDDDDDDEQVIPGVLKESNSGDDESSEENFPEDQLESEENEDYEDNTLDQQEEQAESGEAEGYEVKITKDHHKAQEDNDEGDEDYDSNEIENVSKGENDLDEIEGNQIATHKEEKEVLVEERESTENDEPETTGASAGVSESGEEESSESESVSDLEGKTKNESGEHQRLESVLNAAETNLETNPEAALKMFNQILLMVPSSLRALLGRTRSLDKLADIHHSNALLDQTIQAYLNVLQMKDLLSDTLFKEIAYRCINRIIFRGHHIRAVPIHRSLIKLFPEEPHHSNQLAVTYLNINKMVEAKRVLTNILRIWPQNGFAMAHYGFILKVGDNNIEKSVGFLRHGIASREPGTLDGRFFFQLGDALMRLGRGNEALEVYEQGVKEELFLSKYQRSLYNVKRLAAQPWWEPEQTNYSEYFKAIQENWQVIRAEGMAALEENHILFQDEAENLRDIGNWKQLELYVRGRRMDSSCAKVPQTCKLVANFPAARDCRRGQVKFSMMEPGTHIWPHCGPTNCRLRAHLGLVVPTNTYIRVAEETRTWEEGKILIFDDSFEHEVWHNGSTMRLILIIDVWHPELTEQEKKSLPDI